MLTSGMHGTNPCHSTITRYGICTVDQYLPFAASLARLWLGARVSQILGILIRLPARQSLRHARRMRPGLRPEVRLSTSIRTPTWNHLATFQSRSLYHLREATGTRWAPGLGPGQPRRSRYVVVSRSSRSQGSRCLCKMKHASVDRQPGTDGSGQAGGQQHFVRRSDR